MGTHSRTWGDVRAADVLAALTPQWQGASQIAEAIGTGKVQAVMYRLKSMAAAGVIEVSQQSWNRGTMMNVFRLKPAAPDQPAG